MTSNRECPMECPKHSGHALLRALQVEQCTHVRTYSQRTTHLGSYLTLGNARRGVAKFIQSGIKNSPAASATRGQAGAIR